MTRSDLSLLQRQITVRYLSPRTRAPRSSDDPARWSTATVLAPGRRNVGSLAGGMDLLPMLHLGLKELYMLEARRAQQCVQGANGADEKIDM